MNKITEAIVLAGGFGTRLAHVLGNVPKPMAAVAGKPFLTYVLDKLQNAGIEHVVLSTGYKHECIANYFENQYRKLKISYAQEQTPLFTGGAIALALKQTSTDNVLVLNGDTLFDIDFEAFGKFHLSKQAPLSVALRQVPNVERYGMVTLNNDNCISGFVEKNASHGEGLINGGIYLVNKQWFAQLNMPEKFSFEKAILEQTNGSQGFGGKAFDGYFIDIGIPEDYARAQAEFTQLFPAPRFLFLDRDGVINRRLEGDYVKHPEEFEFLPGVLEALALFAKHFDKIFVVTNQQGIGKNIFSEEELNIVHKSMCEQVTRHNGRIDKIYFCPDLASAHSPNRKPEIGMAQQTQHDFPEVDFAQSIMVGDAVSDMQFGYKARMKNIYLTNSEPLLDEIKDFTDCIFTDLRAFATAFYK